MRNLILALIIGILSLDSSAWAKKTRTVEPKIAESEKSADKDKDKDDPADEVETGKARAQQLKDGKPIDKAKTEEKIKVLDAQVGDLTRALEGKTVPEPEPTARKKGRKPATQPATQPATAPAKAKKSAE